MKAIQKDGQVVYTWPMKEPLERWAIYTSDPSTKVLNNTTNFVESFNVRIEKFRYKPVVS